MDKLSFYNVNSEYVNYLREFENGVRGFSRVPMVGYEQHGRNGKFFCGIVLKINDYQYYVPVSSYTKDHEHTYYLYENTKRIASLRFDYMFPVPPELISLKDITQVQDLKYQRLLGTELMCCRKNETIIREYALRTYVDVLTPVHEGCRDTRDRSCSFRVLEEACKAYCREHGILLDKRPKQLKSLNEILADAELRANEINRKMEKVTEEPEQEHN